MANIAIVSADVASTAATNVAAAFTGDTIVYYNDSNVTLAQLQTHDLIVAPRVRANVAAVSQLLESAHNAGIPILSGSYTNISADSTFTETWEVRKGLVDSVSVDGGQFNSITLNQDPLNFYPTITTYPNNIQVYNNVTFAASFVTTATTGVLIAKGINKPSEEAIIAFDEGVSLPNGQTTQARTIVCGNVYGIGGITPLQAEAFRLMRDWLLTPPLNATVSGVITDGVTPLERNITLLNKSDKSVFASARSASDGTYSVPVPSGNVFIVICEDEGQTPRNALIFDNVTGVDNG